MNFHSKSLLVRISPPVVLEASPGEHHIFLLATFNDFPDFHVSM